MRSNRRRSPVGLCWIVCLLAPLWLAFAGCQDYWVQGLEDPEEETGDDDDDDDDDDNDDDDNDDDNSCAGGCGG